jgi:hypothetical protein
MRALTAAAGGKAGAANAAALRAPEKVLGSTRRGNRPRQGGVLMPTRREVTAGALAALAASHFSHTAFAQDADADYPNPPAACDLHVSAGLGSRHQRALFRRQARQALRPERHCGKQGRRQRQSRQRIRRTRETGRLHDLYRPGLVRAGAGAASLQKDRLRSAERFRARDDAVLDAIPALRRCERPVSHARRSHRVPAREGRWRLIRLDGEYRRHRQRILQGGAWAEDRRGEI